MVTFEPAASVTSSFRALRLFTTEPGTTSEAVLAWIAYGVGNNACRGLRVAKPPPLVATPISSHRGSPGNRPAPKSNVPVKRPLLDRKSTRLNSSHLGISY